MSGDEERFYLTDCRRAGYCVKGTRRLCEEHGVDFRDFIQNGMSVAEARKRGHVALVDHILRVKRDRDG